MRSCEYISSLVPEDLTEGLGTRLVYRDKVDQVCMYVCMYVYI